MSVRERGRELEKVTLLLTSFLIFNIATFMLTMLLIVYSNLPIY